MTRQQWEQLSEDDYRRLFKGSAVKRAKYAGLMRNIHNMSAQSSATHPLSNDEHPKPNAQG